MQHSEAELEKLYFSKTKISLIQSYYSKKEKVSTIIEQISHFFESFAVKNNIKALKMASNLESGMYSTGHR